MMANSKEKAAQFRKLHVAGAPLVLYNVWDAGSAKAVADSGATAIATGSWAVAHASKAWAIRCWRCVNFPATDGSGTPNAHGAHSDRDASASVFATLQPACSRVCQSAMHSGCGLSGWRTQT